MALPMRIESDFDGRTLVTYTYRERPCWIAKDVGRLLGYSADGRRLVANVSSDWADEMIEGHDFVVIAGEELAAFKELAPDSGTTFAGSLLLLFEPGLHLVCIKSRSERGKALRRLLADEVLPQIVRTGRYEPEAPAPALDEEARTRRGDLLYRIVSKLEQYGNLSPASKAELYARCYREATGEDAPALLPVVDSHPHTCTSIGVGLGISSIKVGKIARELGIWQRPPYCEVRLSKSRSSDRQVEQVFFSDEARALIETFHRNRDREGAK